MGSTGTTTVDFGSFPGTQDTSVAVTGQTGIVSGSLVEAWIRPVATSDHTADEHIIEPIKVIAGNISAGVGFTIYALNANVLTELEDQTNPAYGRIGKLQPIYGQWTVSWVWN
jgi:hypothetical protein